MINKGLGSPPKPEETEAESKESPEQGKIPIRRKDEKKEETRDNEAELKEQLETKEREVAENYDRLLRAQAEFENYKKRMEREKEDTVKFCNESLLKEFLPVVDSLEMALMHGRDSNNSESLLEGIEMVLSQFLKTLEKFGVSGFSSIGEPFDPNRHEAMMQTEDDAYAANTIVSELQKGYFLNNRLLRPAKVTVATAPRNTTAGEGDVGQG